MVKSFLEKHQEFSDILSELFQQTVYYTTREVIDGIRRVVSRYIRERDAEVPLYVNLPASYGSERWIYKSVRDLLPPHEILTDIELIQDRKIDIVFMDDWILSGANACGQLENALWGTRGAKVMPQVTYTVLTFISTREAQYALSSLCMKYYRKVTIKFMSEVTLEQFKPKSDELAFLKEFLPEVDRCSYPVHLEYKVANQHGSFPTIYNRCRDTPCGLSLV
jgi:hypothetical protein